VFPVVVGQRARAFIDKHLGEPKDFSVDSRDIGEMMIENLKIAIDTLRGHMEDYERTHHVHFLFIVGYAQGSAMAFYEQRHRWIKDRQQLRDYEVYYRNMFLPLHVKAMSMQDKFMHNNATVWPPP